MRLRRPIIVLAAIVAALAVTGGTSRTALAQPATQDIGSPSGPLTHVYIGTDLSCNVAHTGDQDPISGADVLEFYPPDTIPGDCGTMLAVGGTVYAPDWNSHDGTATGSFGTPFTPVSQSAVTGAGTAGSPYMVTTVADAGTSGIRITETDSYVVGSESYRTSLLVTNMGGSAASVIVFRAGDCYLGSDDEGYGFRDATTKAVACTKNENNAPPARIEQFSGITPIDHSVEVDYPGIWDLVAAGTDLPDTCDCSVLEDNAIGINWDRTLPAGGSVTLSSALTFSPLGTQPLVVTKTADASTADAGGPDGYTITIENPNTTDADVEAVTDTLPAGFSYTMGSSSGLTTTDPGVSGQTLTWNGPFTVTASSSATLHFNVTVASIPDLYRNSADITGFVGGSVPAVDTAPITVNAVTPTPTATATFTETPTATAIATNTPTPTNTAVGSPVPTNTSTNTPTATSTTVATATATNTATATATNTATATATNTATATATNTATATATNTATATATNTATATATNTAAATATNTATATATATTNPCATPTDTELSAAAAHVLGGFDSTAEATTTRIATTRTVEATRTVSATGTVGASTTTPSPTATATNTATATDTATATATATATNTATPTATDTATSTSTATASSTNTATSTATNTSTATPTATATNTSTATATATVCATETVIVRTATPQTTGTVGASTSVPSSTASSSATATRTLTSNELGNARGPSAGASGLPNTGSGTGHGATGWLLGVAAIVIAIGGLMSLVAVQRRR